MDIGIIAARYAKALLRFSLQNEEAQGVYAEMKQLHHSYQVMPQLTTAINNPTLSTQEQSELLRAACLKQQQEKPTQSTTRFINLVAQHKRTALMPFIATAFAHQYEQSLGVVSANLFVATPIGENTEQRLSNLVAQRAEGRDVHLSVHIDASLEAGFVLEYDDYRMDASLKGQFERLRRQFQK